MNKMNRVLLMLIAMVSIMLLAVGIDRGIKHWEEKRWESEREAFYEQSRNEIREIQTTIQTLSEDPQALTAYMEENGLNYVEDEEELTESAAEEASEEVQDLPVEAEADMAEAEPAGEESPEEEEPWPAKGEDPEEITEGMFHGEDLPEETVSGNTVSENIISGNVLIKSFVSGNSISGNSISGNIISGNVISGNAVSGNIVTDPYAADFSLRPPTKSKVCASYEETMRINQNDKAVIAGSDIDFSQIKITCLGDSVTAGSNLSKLENYETMSYPYQLGRILNAKEVVNLGIGGSSIGRYWENAFVDRYSSIPADTDIIIVMGGTNDGFCASEKELGSLEERRDRTFAGDLDELLRKLKTDYPDAEIVLATPLSNVLHDMLRRDRSFLLPQSSFVKIMNQLAAEYGVPVIDLYGCNLLNTHDAAVIHSFMPDGVHGNEMGYRVLAEHFAAELIRIYEAGKTEPAEGQQSDMEETAGTEEQTDERQL